METPPLLPPHSLGHPSSPFICNQNALMRQPPSIRVSQSVSSVSALPSAPTRLEPEPCDTRNRSRKLGASRSFFPTEHYGARQIASPRSTANMFRHTSERRRAPLVAATEPERDKLEHCRSGFLLSGNARIGVESLGFSLLGIICL